MTHVPPPSKVVVTAPPQNGRRAGSRELARTLVRAGACELRRSVLPVGPEIDHQVRAPERSQVGRFGTPHQRRRPVRRVVARVPSQEHRRPERAVEELLPRDHERVQARGKGHARSVTAPRQRDCVGSDAPARVHHHEVERRLSGCVARFSRGIVIPLKPMYLRRVAVP